MAFSVDDALIRRFRRLLLRWYFKHRRALPWRSRRGLGNPYHVFISEAMLQQTQVATVIAYFSRFIEAFPTLESLAAGDEQQVLRLWQGLGYYRRARHLHAAARAMVAEHGGRVPGDVDKLMTLPGVGRYTAGAVASIAHNQAVPILDGNVARVLARWFAVREPVDIPATREKLWELAARLVPPERPGDFNQALMELGALVCTPRQAKCLVCPVVGDCQAAKQQLVDRLPAKRGKKAPRAVAHHIVAIQRGSGGAFLFEQRPGHGLWSKMWQFPTAEELPGQIEAAAVEAWVGQRMGLLVTAMQSGEPFHHQTTHRTITFTLWRAKVAGGRLRPGMGTWRKLDAIDDLPLANPQRRAVDWVKEAPQVRDGDMK